MRLLCILNLIVVKFTIWSADVMHLQKKKYMYFYNIIKISLNKNRQLTFYNFIKHICTFTLYKCITLVLQLSDLLSN